MVIYDKNPTIKLSENGLFLNYINVCYYILIFFIFNEIFMSSLSTIIIFRFGGAINIIVYTIATILFCLLQMRIPREKSNQILLIFFVIIFFIIFIGFIRVTEYAYTDIKIIFMIFVIIFGGRNTKWLNPFFNMMMCFGMVYVITTIWFSIDKSIYFSVFANNIYDPENFVYYNFNAPGQMAGITSHYSMNGIMLANYSILLFSKLWDNKKENKLFPYLFFIASIVAIILCGKRAHFLFTIIACLSTSFILFRKKRHGFIKIFIALALLLVLFFILLSSNTVFIELIDRFSDLSKDSNVKIRLEMWNASLDGFRRNPLFGVGWFGARTLTSAVNGNHKWDSHNTYVQILSETGIIGALPFLIFFIESLTKANKLVDYCSKYSIGGSLRTYAIFSLTYQIFFLLYGVTGSTVQEISLVGVYFVAVFICFHYLSVVKKRIDRL